MVKDTNREGPQPQDVDAMLPPDMALACEAAGVAKAGRDTLTLLLLGVLAGAFIAFGAILMTVAMTGAISGAGDVPWGHARLIGGVAFSLGLVLVIISGAELFTGDTLMIMASAGGKITAGALLRAWALVYAGNIIGALGTVIFMVLAGHHTFGGGLVGQTALEIAAAKSALPAGQVFVLAILCNVLVCLAVWMSFATRSIAGKVLVIVPPITAFVAAGFEHSIANLYLLPYALAIKDWAGPEFWASIGQTADAYAIIGSAEVVRNIVFSTLGNLVGGSLLVGLVYWVIYLRPVRGGVRGGRD